MSGSVNRSFLIGRCGKDPTVRETQAGTKIVSFSLATSESWKDRNSGERKTETQWHQIVIFNSRLADVAEKYVKKGSHLVVEGAIKNRKWTDQSTGTDRYVTEIVIPAFGGNLQVLTPHASNQPPPREEERQPARTDPKGNPQWDDPAGGVLDDEIPL